MERGAGLSRYHHPKPTSGSDMDRPENPNPTREPGREEQEGEKDNMIPPQICMVREQDQYMPIANVIRIMRRILPAHAKISDDAKETIQECVSEFISFVTGEANERCQREQRKTITAEDVLWAMGKLGFDDYVEPLTLFLTRYRESESDRGSLRTESQYKPAGGFIHGGLSNPQMVSPQGPYGYGMFDPSMMMGGGYYQHGPSGQGSSSSAMGGGMPVYDPYGQYK